mmetsp:Transcript_29324/g.70769  ORF Transcript_29324/g.70769 Transcript_29324/m.70769 type:complete len:424 (+) Transcript_29324:203-1474(+)
MYEQSSCIYNNTNYITKKSGDKFFLSQNTSCRHLRQCTSIAAGKVDVLAPGLLVEVVRNSGKGEGGGGEQAGENLGGGDGALGSSGHLPGSLEAGDELAPVGVGVVGRAVRQAGLALSGLLVEALADLEDLVLVLLIAVVVVVLVLGLLAGHALVVDEGLLGVGEGLSVGELLVGARGRGVGARLVHEDAEVDVFAIRGAVRADEELHLLVLVVAVVVLLLVTTILLLLVVVVLEGLVVDVELLTLDGVLELELDRLVVAVIVIVIPAVIETGVHVARVLVVIVAVLPDHLTVVLLCIQLALDVRLHELVHVDHVIGAVATGVARARGTQLEVNQSLLVHAVVVLTVVAAAVVVPPEVSAVVVVGRGALLELEGVAGDPAEVVAVETTSSVEDARGELGVGGDIVGGNLDRFARRGGCGQGGD